MATITLENNTTSLLNKRFLVLIFVTLAIAIGSTFYYTIESPKDVPLDTSSDIDWTKPPCNPDELSKDWKETTHPKMKLKSQRREFVYQNTTLKIAFEKGIQGETGYQAKDHWHRYNPNSTNNRDLYLDRNGKPVGKNSDPSHITTNCD